MAGEDQSKKAPPIHSSFSDPNQPLDPSDIPPHMRDIFKGGNLNETEETEQDTSPRVRSFDDLPTETKERMKGLVLEPSEFDVAGSNVLGVNPASGRPIVAPTKQDSSVFGEPAPVVEGRSFNSFTEMMSHVRQVTDYKPMELPSRGYLYPKGSPIGSGQILVRPMRSEEEEIILNGALLKGGEAIEMIMKRCVMIRQGSMSLKNPLGLLSHDRTAIMIFLRGLTNGPIYEASFSCGKCGHAYELNIDLDNDLDVAYCNDPEIQEPMRTVLPQTGITVEYRLSRGEDEHAVYQHVEERKKKRGLRAGEDAPFFRICRLVTGVQHCATQEQREQVLKSLSAQDLNHIRHQIEYPSFGVDTSILVTCPACSSEASTRLPMGIDFFSPQMAMRRRKGPNQ